MSAVTIVFVVFGAIWLIAELLKKPDQNSRVLIDARVEEKQFIELQSLGSHSKLHEQGSYVVQTFRQSGNPHQEDRFFNSASQAIAAATSTFKRSKIDALIVHQSTEVLLSVRRPFHDHRGRNEGKKVGWIDIRRLS